MNGETNKELFFAGRIACAGENTNVTFVLTPSASSLRAAWIPASVQGILITKLLQIDAIFFPSATISSASSRCGLISTEIGNFSYPSIPSSFTQSAISLITVRNGFPLTIIWRGFVVTPSIPNVWYASLISSIFALSRKYFIFVLLLDIWLTFLINMFKKFSASWF